MPLFVRRNFTVSFGEQDKIVSPSAEKQQHSIKSLSSHIVLSKEQSFVFHNFIVEYVEAKNSDPSGEKEQQTTAYSERSVLSKCPFSVLHNLREESPDPDNANVPSGEKQQHQTE